MITCIIFCNLFRGQATWQFGGSQCSCQIIGLRIRVELTWIRIRPLKTDPDSTRQIIQEQFYISTIPTLYGSRNTLGTREGK